MGLLSKWRRTSTSGLDHGQENNRNKRASASSRRSPRIAGDSLQVRISSSIYQFLYNLQDFIKLLVSSSMPQTRPFVHVLEIGQVIPLSIMTHGMACTGSGYTAEVGGDISMVDCVRQMSSSCIDITHRPMVNTALAAIGYWWNILEGIRFQNCIIRAANYMAGVPMLPLISPGWTFDKSPSMCR